MDKIDQKILSELDINPKLPLSMLARKLKISQQVADYRVKRMLDNGLVLKFTPIINLKALGYEHYRIFFTFAKNTYSNQEIFSYLQKTSGIYWAARIGGKYDLIIVLWVPDYERFEQFIDHFNQKFPGLVKDYASCYGIDHQIFRHKYLSGNYSSIKYGYNERKQEIDELDHYVLHKIKDNCRISALELSKDTEFTYKTIINRIKALEKNKIILGYRTYFRSIEEMQAAYIVLFSFRNFSKEQEKILLSYIARLKPVTQSIRLFGTWNLFLHVRITSNKDLQDVVIELRDKFEIIDKYEVIPVFEDIAINLMPI